LRKSFRKTPFESSGGINGSHQTPEDKIPGGKRKTKRGRRVTTGGGLFEEGL